jgi:integrase
MQQAEAVKKFADAFASLMLSDASILKAINPQSHLEDQLTIKQAVEFYTVNKKMVQSTRVRSVKPALAYFSNYFGEDTLIESVIPDKKLIREFVDNLFNTKKYHYGSLIYRCCKAFSNYMLERGYVSYVAFNSIKQERNPDESEITVIPDDHLTDILNKVTDPQHKRYIHLLRFTGLRPGEVMKLQLKDFDPLHNTLKIGGTGKRTKTGKVRVIPVSTTAADILREEIRNVKVLKPDALIFQSPAPKITKHRTKDDPPFVYVDLISGKFKQACKDAGYSDYKLYCLRHTFASSLLNKGVPLEQISKLLGHTTTAITEKHYAKMNTETLRGAVDLVDSINANNNFIKKVI